MISAPFLATMALFDGSLSTDTLSRLDAKVVHREEKKEKETLKIEKQQQQQKRRQQKRRAVVVAVNMSIALVWHH